MDPTTVRNCILATLDPNAEIRRTGEQDLKQAEHQPGFIDCLMNILDLEQAQNIRLGAVIYLKNRVHRAWSVETNNITGEVSIPEDEKERLKERLLPLLAVSQGVIRQNIVPTLQRILHWDFPSKWPSFMNYTIELLQTNDKGRVLAGLQCLLAICRAYRFKPNDAENKAQLASIVESSFPRLLEICRELVVQEGDDAGEMLHIALKSYKHATFLDLLGPLGQQQTNMAWCEIFLQTVSRAVPATAMPEDVTEREKHHWWKAKKWAFYNLNRLYQRHGSLDGIGKESPSQIAFAKEFTATIAPEILKHYLREIEKWVGKTAWLSRPCLSYIIVFLDECIRPKEMWGQLKPDLNNLIQHFIFPVMCLSEEDVENFEDQPEEYLHRKLNFYEEVSAPDVAATNFLVNLTKLRRKETYEVLQFINTVVNEYEVAPEDKKNHIAKEGALRMIGTLAPVILSKKSPIAEQVEYFMVRYVFPDFTNPQGFLRARACDTIEKFEQLDFKEQANLLTVYRNILECMADPALPVRVTAALALQPLIRHDIIRRSMQQSIPTIMQQLLKLANEADIDALANVMEDFVEVFAKELTPFAVALSQQLRETYIRLVRELLEKSAGMGEGGEEYSDFLDDKSITALGVLQTIGTLILTLESTPEVLSAIETILMPVIEITLENKLYDLYNEVFEIVDSCTFSAKAISPIMWKAFELIHKTFKSGAELYLEDMLPALDNFVQYGAPTLAQQPAYTDALYDMVKVMFEDVKVGGVDRICACKLAEAMMLSLRGCLDNYIEGFVTMAMNLISTSDLKIKSVKIHLMEMVINAIYYNPLLTLQILEAKGWTNKFFSLWFSSMELFTRVHDKKLCIVAIVALLSIKQEHIPQSISVGWPRLLQGITVLFRSLPTAEKNRAEAMKEDFTLESGGYDDDDEDDDEWNEEETTWGADENAEEEASDVKDQYLEFLHEESQKFGNLSAGANESDDDLGEHSLLMETPLDKVEPYQIFKASLMQLQQEQPQFYQSLASHLSAEEQSVVQQAVNQADALILAMAQNQAAAAAAAANGGAS